MSKKLLDKPDSDHAGLSLNRDHPGFDEALEVLCMLSAWPGVRFLSDLCVDMGYDADEKIDRQLRDLRKRGFRVVTSEVRLEGAMNRTGIAAWIEESGKDYAEEAALAYYAQVYE